VNDIAISIEGLSKSYVLGHQTGANRNLTFRETVVNGARSIARTTGDLVRGRALVAGDEKEEFWALKDVSLEVKRGEVLGIIGRNGAGKSTLLKILSRITEPTRGRVALAGRVGSLLEVGTGFHPELSGRENIYLNGAVLGMSRAEINRKFDEIVAFAEVTKFLDTPVKRYSSGMYVRLAFAVAAHLEPEILVVDEVLAVGDAQFQKKCLGKMQDVATGGRTVLFVSHNLAAVEQLTHRAMILDAGLCIFLGPTAEALEKYADADLGRNAVTFDVEAQPRKYSGTGAARLTRVRFDRASAVFASGEPFEYFASVRATEDIPRMRFSMTFFSVDGVPIGSCFGPDTLRMSAGQLLEVRLAVSNLMLAPGKYYCGLSIGKGDHRTGHLDFDVVLDTLQFEVRPEEGEAGTVSHWTRGWGAIMFQPIEQTAMGSRP
jgi:lipopolysaccharide transport system ATP-binding protein